VEHHHCKPPKTHPKSAHPKLVPNQKTATETC
jgi:hypothetical protein